MRGAVIYYSRYGNNELTAKAVKEGLEESGHEVDLVNAKDSKDLGEGYDFVVVGSPTRAGRMSGPIKKFIKNNLGEDWRGKPFAAFGTCMKRTSDKGEPSGAGSVYEELEQRGLEAAAPAMDAAVKGMRGPLQEGVEAKARDFGKEVGAKLSG